jgi:hypothetical protein
VMSCAASSRLSAMEFMQVWRPLRAARSAIAVRILGVAATAGDMLVLA